jgi:hypothetical protein
VAGFEAEETPLLLLLLLLLLSLLSLLLSLSLSLLLSLLPLAARREKSARMRSARLVRFERGRPPSKSSSPANATTAPVLL